MQNQDQSVQNKLETRLVSTTTIPKIEAFAYLPIQKFIDERIYFNEIIQMKVKDGFREYLRFLYENEELRTASALKGLDVTTLDAFIQSVESIKKTRHYPNFIIPRRKFGKVLEYCTQQKAERGTQEMKKTVKLVRSHTLFLKGIGVSSALLTRPPSAP